MAATHWSAGVETVTKVAGTVGLVSTAALFLGRLLFWAAPSFGRLQMGSMENPNEDVRSVVSTLRRWAPRRDTRRASEWFATALLGLSAVEAGFAVAHAVDPLGIFAAPEWAPAAAWPAILAQVVMAVLLVAPTTRADDRSFRPLLPVVDDLDRCSAESAARFLETVHTLLQQSGGSRRRPVAPLIVLIPADSRWVRTAFSTRYQDFSGLGDEAKSLGADFVQKLFEHTVLVPELSPEQVREFGRGLRPASPSPSAGSPRRPNQRGVAVPSPGSAPHAPRDSDVSAQPSQPVLSLAEPHDASRPARGQAYLDELRNRVNHAGVTPQELADLGAQVSASLDLAGAERIQNEIADRLLDDDLSQEREHLLLEYAESLPPNPRLIKRVANYWSMLQTIQLLVRHRISQDVVMRAAIVAVQFPTLAELIQQSPWLPEIDRRRLDGLKDARQAMDATPPTSPEAQEVSAGTKGLASADPTVDDDAPADVQAVMTLLRRPDIRRLLNGPDGIVRLTDLARALGRTSGVEPYDPERPTPTAAPSEAGAPTAHPS